MNQNQRLAAWCQAPCGASIYECEYHIVQAMLSQCLGYYLLHLGPWPLPPRYHSTHIKNQYVISPYRESSDLQQVAMQYSELAFLSDSIDAVYCPHVVEFSECPHMMLREIERVLVPEGHVIISCFNPLSVWRLVNWLDWRQPILPKGRYYREGRLLDWLVLLGFDVLRIEYLPLLPPVQQGVCHRLAANLGLKKKRWLQRWGCGFVIMAKKKSIALTPIKYKWAFATKDTDGRHC